MLIDGVQLVPHQIAQRDFEIICKHAVFSLSPDVLCDDMAVE